MKATIFAGESMRGKLVSEGTTTKVTDPAAKSYQSPEQSCLHFGFRPKLMALETSRQPKIDKNSWDWPLCELMIELRRSSFAAFLLTT